MKTIFDGVAALIAEHAPDAAALEESYVGADARIALSVGQARGAVLVACAAGAVEAVEYAPALVKQAYLARISLSATGYYATPNIHYDRASASGRPFYYFAYGAAVSEVLVDTLTGEAGRIRDVVYVGMVTRYVVELDSGGELVVVRQNLETSSQEALEARGRRVRLEWKPEHTFVIEEGNES